MARRLILKKKKSNKSQKSKGKEQMGKSIGRSIVVGLFGGVFWGLIGMICKLLNFSKTGPELLLAPFPLPAWKNKIGGEFLAVAGLIILSVLLAIVYQLVLSRFKSFWVGICFGLLLWGVVFFALQPLLPHLPFLTHLGWNTLSTTVCLFLLYGLFIGYSISFEVEEGNADPENYSKE
ncbi:MAG: YqhR family membrane protein [Sporolactobacillus sp.]